MQASAHRYASVPEHYPRHPHDRFGPPAQPGIEIFRGPPPGSSTLGAGHGPSSATPSPRSPSISTPPPSAFSQVRLVTMSRDAPPGTKVYVGNLEADTQESALTDEVQSHLQPSRRAMLCGRQSFLASLSAVHGSSL